MKILRYSFYRFYQLMNKVGNGDVAEYSAILLMSLLAFINILSLLSLSDIILNFKVDISQSPKLISLMLLFGLVILFYFLFVRKDRHLEIAKEYENETSKKKIIGNILALSYILMSFVLLMLCFYLMIQKNRGLITNYPIP